MPRLTLASLCVLICTLPAFAADPEPTPIEKQLTVQSTMLAARQYLDAKKPAEAIAVLEKDLASANGSMAYLNLLREAYLAELFQLEKTPNVNAERLAQTRRKLALLGAENAEGVSPPLAQTTPKTKVEDAVAAFKQGDFAQADKLFASIGAAKLTTEQKTAWGYCRIKLAADRVNAPNCDAATAAAAAQDVADALELITDNAKLLATGRQVLKAAQEKAAQASGGGKQGEAPDANATTLAKGDGIETASFRVVHTGNREVGDSVAKAAEASRKQIFERWSGPPGGAWQPKCEIVLHATAASYAKATGKPAALTGHATIRLTNGRATARRIDLRIDDTAMIANTLPRELTHVVLADLFADKPPPKWAEEGMAILAGSPEEISRYTRTLTRCARDAELRNLATLFDLNDFPAEKVTGFYCQSVSVTEYLIKLNGERNFKIFLNDVQRYGVAPALKRQYGIDGPQALEQAWKRACLDQIRGQSP